MLKEDKIKIMKTIKRLKQTLSQYFAEHEEIVLAYLFGSVAEGKENRLSDIDIAILVDEKRFKELDERLPYGYRASITADLMDILKFGDIDVVILNHAPPLLAHQVVKKGKIIYSRNEKLRVKFQVKALQEYIDTAPLREIKRKYLYMRIKSGAFGKVGITK